MKRDRVERWGILLLAIGLIGLGIVATVLEGLTGRIFCDRRAICPEAVEIDGWFYLHLLLQAAIFLIPGILGLYYFLRNR